MKVVKNVNYQVFLSQMIRYYVHNYNAVVIITNKYKQCRYIVILAKTKFDLKIHFHVHNYNKVTTITNKYDQFHYILILTIIKITLFSKVGN